MSSHDHVLARLTFTTRVAKRAQFEAFEFTIVPEGVRVRNTSHANPADHEYLVTVRDGLPVACECPADEHYEGACKHRVAVAIRTPLLQAVTATSQCLRTDGGSNVNDEHDYQSPDTTADQSADCVCAELGDFPCWECVRTGRRDIPNQ